MTADGSPGHELVLGCFMDETVAVAGSDDGDLIGNGRNMWQKVGNFDPGLAPGIEFPLTGHDHIRVAQKLRFNALKRFRQPLSVVLLKDWFGIQKINLAWAATHKEHDA
jgi:hypothetical protein